MSLSIAANSDVISFTDSGQEFHLIAVVTAAGTYTTGGDVLTTLFSKEVIKTHKANYAKAILASNCPTSVGGEVLHYFSYDKANNKLKCFLASTGVEVANLGAYPTGVITIQAWFKKK